MVDVLKFTEGAAAVPHSDKEACKDVCGKTNLPQGAESLTNSFNHLVSVERP